MSILTNKFNDVLSKLKKWILGTGTTIFRNGQADIHAPAEAYAMLFGMSPLPQAVMSYSGIYLDVNAAFLKLQHLEQKELVGLTPADAGLCTASQLERFLEMLRQAQYNIKGEILTYKLPDQTELFVRAFIHPITFGDDKAILTVFDNVTGQIQAERQVMKSQEFLQEVLDSLPMRVFWKDTQSTFLGCNQLAANDVGISSPKEIVGKTDYDFVDKDLAEKYVRADQEVILHGRETLFYDEIHRQSNGKLQHNLVSKVPLKDENGNLIGVLGTYDDVTQRRETEAALKLARFSIDHAMSSILWVSKAGGILDFNNALCELLKYERDELLRLSISDLDPTYGPDRWLEQWKTLRRDQVLKFFAKQRRSDGVVLDIEVRAHYLEFEEKEYYCAFIHDVTEQIKAEKSLQMSHEFIHTVLNHIPAGVFWKDRQSRYLGGNAMFRTIANYNEEHDFIGKTDEDFPWREQAEELRADDQYVMDNNLPKLYYVEPLRNADGKIHYNEVSKVPLINENGEVTGVLGTFRDITAQQEAELALKKSQKLLLGVVQNVSAIIYLIDTHGIVTLSEGLDLEVLGLAPGELTGKSVFALYADQPEIISSIRQALAGENSQCEISIGNTTFSNRYTPIRDETSNVTNVLCVSFNITGRKQMEVEMNSLNDVLEERVEYRTAQLQQANQDLEAFAYSVSHDLRAPIRHIDGFSKLMYAAIPNPSELVTKHFDRVITSSKRMSSMVDDLLTFARLGRKPITKSVVDLDKLFRSVVKRLELDAGNRQITWKIGTLGTVQGDGNLLQLAFENILSNAVKYTLPRPVATIEVGSHRTGQELEIYVRDNGVGFDMTYADHLFGVFQRLHAQEEFEGTGIGLANARQIVLKHKGSIRAEGKVDEGAIFFVTIPIT